MMLDISDAITPFGERCVRLWSISSSMAGDLKTEEFVRILVAGTAKE